MIGIRSVQIMCTVNCIYCTLRTKHNLHWIIHILWKYTLYTSDSNVHQYIRVLFQIFLPCLAFLLIDASKIWHFNSESPLGRELLNQIIYNVCCAQNLLYTANSTYFECTLYIDWLHWTLYLNFLLSLVQSLHTSNNLTENLTYYKGTNNQRKDLHLE